MDGRDSSDRKTVSQTGRLTDRPIDRPSAWNNPSAGLLTAERRQLQTKYAEANNKFSALNSRNNDSVPNKAERMIRSDSIGWRVEPQQVETLCLFSYCHSQSSSPPPRGMSLLLTLNQGDGIKITSLFHFFSSAGNLRACLN